MFAHLIAERRSILLLLLTGRLLAAPSAGGASGPIPGLFPTGIDAQGLLLSGGARDPHWTLVGGPPGPALGPATYVVLGGFPIPPWLANGPASAWIAPRADQSQGELPGNYTYRLSFVLDGLDPSTAVVSGRWSSDNAGVEVRLNGVPTGLLGNGDFTAFSPRFTLAEGFVEGTNVLEFVVNNAGEGVNPTGFRAELEGVAEPWPGPGVPPAIRRPPEGVAVAAGEAAAFRVAATGSRPLSYQWRLDGSPLAEAHESTFSIAHVNAAWIGAYDVVVRNAYGAVTSQVARLTLHYPLPVSRLRESPGPSSRRTGIVLSEIHLRPEPRADGRRLEFVELWNSNPFFEDLGGWRLSGPFEFVFPAGTILAGRAHLVVAPRPEDLAAAHGITNLIGGFRPPSPNAVGTVRLWKQSGALLLEVPLEDGDPWPAASFGGGHSLVLCRPSFGEADPEAWEASTWKGGSPGGHDPVPADPAASVFLQELLVHPQNNERAFVEIHNAGSQPVDLSGWNLREANTAAAERFPAGSILPPAGFFTAFELASRLDPRGGRLILEVADGTRVADATRFGALGPGRALGREPGGFRRIWTGLDHPTPGTANAAAKSPAVVISEIHYHPPWDREDEAFVELHNPGDSPVDLAGWRFTDGIEFGFEPGAVLPPGGYVVVVPDVARFRARDPDLAPERIFGGYRGGLSDRGERLALARPEFHILPSLHGPVPVPVLVEVDAVTYRDGGRWGRWADGGGTSLERLDPRGDSSAGPNWADSENATPAPWTTVEATGRLGLTHPGVPQADQLQVMLLGAGEALVDDVEVLVDGVNRIVNPRFAKGTSGWYFQGTHRLSRWDTNSGPDDGRCLRLVAVDRGDHVANRVRTVLSRPIPAGTNVTLRARVRWLRGHPEILLRLRNGGLEAAGRLALPAVIGSPGRPNSQRPDPVPPLIQATRHQPVLPAAGQAVRVTARVTDPDGVARVALRYRVDPATELRETLIRDDGTGPDETAGDGFYSGEIPGQPAGSLVAFRLEAVDSRGAAAVFPDDAPERECLVRFGEPAVSTAASALGTYRIWMTKAAHDRWAAREKMSNEDVPVTFVAGGERVIYGAGAHYSGSSYTSPGYTSPTGALCGYDLRFPEDDRYLGANSMTLDWPIRDDTNQREQLMFWFLEQFGLPNMYRRYVHLFVNGVRRGPIYDDVEQPGRDTVDAWFPDDAEGSLWKTDCWNEFGNSGERVDPCVLNTLQRFPSSGPLKTARYRWNWRPRAVRGSANDFTDLFALVDALNASSRYVEEVEALVDVDHWMRTFAMNDLASFWDAFGNPNAKNTFLYKPERDRWKLMCWDFDVGLGVFNDPPNAPLFDVQDPALQRMYRTPAFVRRYWAALDEAVNGFFRAGSETPVNRLLDAKYQALRSAGVQVAGPAGIQSWITQRRSFLISQLATVRAPFRITSPANPSTESESDSIVLRGTAPVGVQSLSVNDRIRTVQWSSVSNWSVTLPLQTGWQTLRILGLDREGRPVPGTERSLDIRFTGLPPAPPAVRINEWMAANQGAVRDPIDGAFDDWFELYNASVATVDLAAWSLTDTPTDPRRHVIPPGFVLPPGGWLLVWADGEPEQTRPGVALHVGFRLDRQGSDLMLFDSLGRMVDSVRFGSQLTDRSEGRWGDGAVGPTFTLVQPTPGARNADPDPARSAMAIGLSARWILEEGTVELAWPSFPGRRYQIEVREDLHPGGEWQAAGEPILADRQEVRFRMPLSASVGGQFFRVTLLP